MNSLLLSYTERLRGRKLLGAYADAGVSTEAKSGAPCLSPEILLRVASRIGVSIKDLRGAFLRIALVSAFVIAMIIASSKPVLILLLAVYIVLERKQLNSRVYRKAEEFERDYPALLLSLASGVRTGLDPLQALIKSQQLFQAKSEMCRELRVLNESIDNGIGEDAAIMQFGADIRHPDLELFREAFILARKEGSSLAECLQRLARVTRQRQSFRRKIRSAVAMQRLSAVGIAACTVAIGLIQVSTNPQAMQIAWNNPVGMRALIGGIGLVLLGLVWMLSLSRSRL